MVERISNFGEAKKRHDYFRTDLRHTTRILAGMVLVDLRSQSNKQPRCSLSKDTTYALRLNLKAEVSDARR